VADRNLPAGLVAIAFSVVGGSYILRALLRALEIGSSPGRLGAVHPAGSMQYIGFVVACGIGIVLMIVLAFLGLRWAGFIKSSRE
jgi:hypothetical protein